MSEKQPITFTLVGVEMTEYKIHLPDDWEFTTNPTKEQVRQWISNYARDISTQNSYQVALFDLSDIDSTIDTLGGYEKWLRSQPSNTTYRDCHDSVKQYLQSTVR